MSLNLNVTDSHNVTECHWIYLEAKWNNSFGKLKFIKILSIKIYFKLKNGENVGEKLFKMVVNVQKLLKMVKNGDFLKFVKKWWNVEKCWWKH